MPPAHIVRVNAHATLLICNYNLSRRFVQMHPGG